MVQMVYRLDPIGPFNQHKCPYVTSRASVSCSPMLLHNTGYNVDVMHASGFDVIYKGSNHCPAHRQHSGESAVDAGSAAERPTPLRLQSDDKS